MWLWAGELPKILEFPFNISATAETSNFKFGIQLGFDKGHHKITPREKGWRGPRLGKLSKILGFPFNISATAEASDFKFCMRFGFDKGHHKITPRGKVGVALD